MFMQPIDHPVLTRSRSQRPAALKLFAGILFVAAMAVVMPLWWAATAIWLPISAIASCARSIARTSYDCVLFAGEAIVGR